MLGNYEIDTKLLGYWILGLTMVLTVLGLYLADFSPSQVFEDEPALEVTVEDDVLEPNELTTLTVTENGEPVQGAEIRADSLNIGETKRNGKLSFRALENDFTLNATYNGESATEEITVLTEEQEEQEEDELDDSEQQEEEQEEQEEEASEEDVEDEGFTGFELEEEPYTGETNRLTLYKEDERTEGETVQLNGDTIGETSQAGSITFTVPDTEQFTLQASEIEQTFDTQLQEPIGEIKPDIQLGGTQQKAETLTLDGSDTTSENRIESFTWTMSFEDYEETINGQTAEYTIQNEGEYTVELEVEDINGFTETETTTFEAEPEYEGPDIYLNEPWDGSQLGPGHLFEFSVTNARNTQQAQIIINEETVASTNLGDGTNIIEEDGEGGLFAEFPVEGTQDYTVKIEDLEQNWESEPMTVEIERPWNQYGTFSATEPEDGATVETEEQENEEGETVHIVEFEFTFDLETDVELQINGQEQEEDGEQENEVEEFSYSSTITEDTETYTAQIETEPGEYSWNSQIQPVNTDETPETTDQKQLTIQQ